MKTDSDRTIVIDESENNKEYLQNLMKELKVLALDKKRTYIFEWSLYEYNERYIYFTGFPECHKLTAKYVRDMARGKMK